MKADHVNIVTNITRFIEFSVFFSSLFIANRDVFAARPLIVRYKSLTLDNFTRTEKIIKNELIVR